MANSFIRPRSRSNSDSSEQSENSLTNSSSENFLSASIPPALRRQSLTGASSSAQPEMVLQSLDLSFAQYTVAQLHKNFQTTKIQKEHILSMNLSANDLDHVPKSIDQFVNLTSLDLSQNALTTLDEAITRLPKLNALIVTNNRLNENSLPKNFSLAFAGSLKVLSLGGNEFQQIPDQIFELSNLRSLYIGGNQLQSLPRKIRHLEKLQNLYLGGNQLDELPFEVGLLSNLQSLSLCENRLRQLPSSIAYLRNLKSLSLHKNELTALPPEIIKLRSLYELSLRDNPLVVRFVRDMVHNPPSLLELAGRSIKVHKTVYDEASLPRHLIHYLSTAQRCVNEKCKGGLEILKLRLSIAFCPSSRKLMIGSFLPGRRLLRYPRVGSQVRRFLRRLPAAAASVPLLAQVLAEQSVHPGDQFVVGR